MEKNSNIVAKFTRFVSHAREEIHKVIFPTKVQIRQAFLAVVLVVAVISIFLGLVDLLMGQIVKLALGA